MRKVTLLNFAPLKHPVRRKVSGDSPVCRPQTFFEVDLWDARSNAATKRGRKAARKQVSGRVVGGFPAILVSSSGPDLLCHGESRSCSFNNTGHFACGLRSVVAFSSAVQR